MKAFRMTDEQHKAWQAKRAKQCAIADGLGTAGNAAHVELALIPQMKKLETLLIGGTPNKYHNEKTNGYASKKESKRAFELKLMQEGGQIRNLREQVQYEIIPKQDGERAAHYVCDFVYEEWTGHSMRGGWTEICEDTKGVRTAEYVLKRKLMLHVHGIKIRET